MEQINKLFLAVINLIVSLPVSFAVLFMIGEIGRTGTSFDALPIFIFGAGAGFTLSFLERRYFNLGLITQLATFASPSFLVVVLVFQETISKPMELKETLLFVWTYDLVCMMYIGYSKAPALARNSSGLEPTRNTRR